MENNLFSVILFVMYDERPPPLGMAVFFPYLEE